MGELAGSNLIELSFDLLDRTDQRPGDDIAEGESEHDAAEREGDHDPLRVFVSLPASFDTCHHVRFGFVDQLASQTIETIGQRGSGFYLARLRRTTGANRFNDMGDDLNKSIVELQRVDGSILSTNNVTLQTLGTGVSP